jgi:hypothetical protein
MSSPKEAWQELPQNASQDASFTQQNQSVASPDKTLLPAIQGAQETLTGSQPHMKIQETEEIERIEKDFSKLSGHVEDKTE